jgi:hypothetical protein
VIRHIVETNYQTALIIVRSAAYDVSTFDLYGKHHFSLRYSIYALQLTFAVLLLLLLLRGPMPILLLLLCRL